jgi:hypothetical protein
MGVQAVWDGATTSELTVQHPNVTNIGVVGLAIAETMREGG